MTNVTKCKLVINRKLYDLTYAYCCVEFSSELCITALFLSYPFYAQYRKKTAPGYITAPF